MKYQKLNDIIANATNIVIVQADNPDGDSLGSALALEEILGVMGKNVSLYCAIDMPSYLKYLTGWSRIQHNLPDNFDASIIVDTSTQTLFEKDTMSFHRLGTKPCVVIDHHASTNNDIASATEVVNNPDISSTCELIYHICRDLDWALPKTSHDPLMTGILGDTQGLSNQLAKAETYRVMAELIEAGADRPTLEETRRSYSKMPEAIYRFKSELISRTEFAGDGKIAIVTLNQTEINSYSPLYNPGPLIQPEMLQVEGVAVGIVFKNYDDGKITAMIRCNNGAEVADKIAKPFGGGGHAYAAGFKITDGRSFANIKADCVRLTTELLAKLA